jgi:hypothetical protein
MALLLVLLDIVIKLLYIVSHVKPTHVRMMLIRCGAFCEVATLAG